MSDIFNPIGRPLPGIAGPTLLSGVIADPPRSLIGLNPGTILKGTVLGRGQDGLTSVATDKGTVKVATTAQLPTGSHVTLEVRSAGDRLQVLILAVEAQGRSASGGATHVRPNQSGGVAADGASQSSSTGQVGSVRPVSTQPAPQPPPIEVVGSSVKAIVVQPPAPGALLNAPVIETEPFVPPPLPTTIPADAVQKAQIIAQAQQFIDAADPQPNQLPSTTPQSGTPQSGAPQSGNPPSANPQLGTPAAGNPQTLAATLNAIPTAGTPPPVAGGAPIPPAGTAANPLFVTGSPQAVLPGPLLPEAAQRITALFAAADAEASKAPAPSNAALAGGNAALAGGNAALAAGSPVTPLKSGILAGGLASGVGTALGALLLGNPANADAAATGAPRLLAAGTELTLHVIAVLQAKGGTIEIAPDAARLAGATAPLIGRVLGYTRAGHPVIETPAGLIMMQQKAQLPVGAQVALVLEPPATPAPSVFPAVTTPQQALLSLSSGWPTLDDLVAVLRGSSGGEASAPGNAQGNTPPPPPGIPQTGGRLAAGLANAIAALRAGDVEKLLGPLLGNRRPTDGKDDAVKRLKDEFTQLSELAKDRPNVDWRALYLPLYDERVGLTQINLYYRSNGGGEGEDAERKERGTRFVVEVNFAALGAFQLDGLIRSKRFDLMIRSRRALTPSQRLDIIKLFEQALELGGCQGGLEFRKVDEFPVSPLDELRQAHDQFTA